MWLRLIWPSGSGKILELGTTFVWTLERKSPLDINKTDKFSMWRDRPTPEHCQWKKGVGMRRVKATEESIVRVESSNGRHNCSKWMSN